MKGLFSLVFLVVFPCSFADDGWVGNGGSPKLMGSHPTIRMVSEVVRLRVGKRTTRADCRFVFHNDGPATTVRVGFPDEDSSGEYLKGSAFESFRSWVDGKPTSTHIEKSGDHEVWRVKSVVFPAHRTVRIRDLYLVETGSGAFGANWGLRYAAYTLHTGASWRGKIGKAEIDFTFLSGLPSPRRIVAYEALDYKEQLVAAEDSRERTRQWNGMPRKHRSTIFWKGPAKPRLKGRTLTFRLRNIEPTERDDIFLAFAPITNWSKHVGY